MVPPKHFLWALTGIASASERQFQSVPAAKITAKKKKKEFYILPLSGAVYCAFINPCPAEPQICPAFVNSVDPDQLASEEAN